MGQVSISYTTLKHENKESLSSPSFDVKLPYTIPLLIRFALHFRREIKVLSELLYFTLTTGNCIQTLGEEYCDIVQAAGHRGGPPATLRRGALVLLQSLGPYLSENALAARNFDSTPSFRVFPAAEQRPLELQQLSDSNSLRSLWAVLRQHLQALRQRSFEVSSAFRGQLISLFGSRGVARIENARQFLLNNSAALVRFHLALFYLTGVYFQLSKRLAGVHYLYSSRVLQGRPMYRALGALLLVQLGVVGSMWALQKHGAPNWLPLPKFGRNEFATEKPQHAILLGEDGKEVRINVESAIEEKESKTESGDVPQIKKCPLCLSQRSTPTATPCGHVFCWQCIAEWATRKPECPLCRADVAPSALVVVRHAGY